MDHNARARSFGSVAEIYHRSRATYPRDAVEWVLEPLGSVQGRAVLDLGAGTGRLSAVLLDLGVQVVAVEPDDAMRAYLPDGVQALAGSAEQVPLPDGSVDAVLVGQAWHWFDTRQALAEVCRVLRPGGVLGLLWNVLDDQVPWTAELARITTAEDRWSLLDDEPPYEGEPAPQNQRFSHVQTMTPDLLVANIASRSRTVLLPPADRDALLQQVRELAPAAGFELPWVCDVWRGQVP